MRAADIVSHAPFVEARVGQDAAIAELARAALIFSDNAAANLLLGTIGGPAGLTAWLRATGDRTTRLDRRETALGECGPARQRPPQPIACCFAGALGMRGTAAGAGGVKRCQPAGPSRSIGWKRTLYCIRAEPSTQ